MSIPSTRAELVGLVTETYTKLRDEVRQAGPAAASLTCVDDWTVKDLLAVRSWWTTSVVAWIDAGRRRESLTLPAPGYRWSETPRLNADIAARAVDDDYEAILQRLDVGFRRTLETIDALDDAELLEVGAFAWAGKWPVSRWISINTARQYTTARTFIRRALREQAT